MIDYKVAELYKSGLGLEAVGEIVGVSRETVRKWLKAMGIERRPAHAPRRAYRPCKHCGTMYTPGRGTINKSHCSSKCFEARMKRKSKRPGW